MHSAMVNQSRCTPLQQTNQHTNNTHTNKNSNSQIMYNICAVQIAHRTRRMCEYILSEIPSANLCKSTQSHNMSSHERTHTHTHTLMPSHLVFILSSFFGCLFVKSHSNMRSRCVACVRNIETRTHAARIHLCMKCNIPCERARA